MVWPCPSLLLALAVLFTCSCRGLEWIDTLYAKYYQQTRNYVSIDGDSRTPQSIVIRAPSSLVECRLSVYPAFNTCNPHAVRAYSGENGSVFLGSFCGSVPDEAFAASDNAMLLVFNITLLPVQFFFNVTYYTQKECRTRLNVTSLPKYLRTPVYTSNSSTIGYGGCWWYLTAPESYQIRLSFSYAPWYTTDCAYDVSVTMTESSGGDYRYRGRTFGKWCGGDDHIFVSFYNYVELLLPPVGSLLPPLQVELLAQPEQNCLTELILRESTGGYITSSGYPNLLELVVCRWVISYYTDEPAVIRLNVTDSDMADTVGCTKDIVRVFDGRDTKSPVSLSWCGNATPSIELYTSKLIVELRTGANHSRKYKGFNLQYDYVSEPSCGGSLTPTTSRQRLTSPGYPQPFRSYLKCMWKLTASVAEFVVKLVILRADLEDIPRPSCSRSSLAVYEGHLETQFKLIKRLCSDGQVSLQSRGQTLLIVFITDNNDGEQRRGFEIDYWEGQYQEHVVASTQERSITLPGYSLNYVSGYDVRWYITNELALHHIAVWFTQVDIYCPSDVITVYDGGIIFPSRVFTFCGFNDRSLLSVTDIIIVVFSTQTNLGKGFTLNYKLLHYQGCFKGVQDVNVESSESHLMSPGLTYFDKLDCRWRFIAKLSSTRIHLVITTFNIVTNSRDSCPSDYIRVYNGYDTSSMAFEPLICGKNTRRVLESASRYLYMEFHTNEVNTDQGFKVTYNSFYPEVTDESLNSPFPVAIVVGVSIGTVLIIALCIVVNVCAWRRRAVRRLDRAQPSVPPERISSVHYRRRPSRDGSGLPPFIEAPPSYSELDFPSNKNDDIPPPSYIEAVSEGMVQFIPRSQAESN